MKKTLPFLLLAIVILAALPLSAQFVSLGSGSAFSTTSITSLTAETTPDNADLLVIYDNSTGALRKMTRGNLLSALAAATATALAANGTNCSAGNYPLGVDASGNVEDCTAIAVVSGDVVGPASSTDNAIARYDSTTGKLLQDGAVTVSDVAGNSVTVASVAGNALALVATAPAATTGASQTGKSTTITASPAVASTDTAGAAAGGSIMFTTGAAARNTSGNANGGDVVFSPGAGIGTGRHGQFLIPAVLDYANPYFSFPGDDDSGITWRSDNAWALVAGAQEAIRLTAAGPITNNGSLKQIMTNGLSVTLAYTQETLTLSTAGTTTDTSANLAPFTPRIAFIAYRVTSTIATATDFRVKVAGGGYFVSAGTATEAQTVLVSGTTGILVPPSFAAASNATAAKLTVDTTGTPSAGAIHLYVVYEAIEMPSS